MRKILVIVAMLLLVVVTGVFSYILSSRGRSTRQVDISSEIKGVNISISDRNKLDALLSDSGFWNFSKWNKQGDSKVRIFKIILTNKPQPSYILLDSSGKTYSSSKVEYHSGVLTLTVQADPVIFSLDKLAWEVEKKIIKLVAGTYPGSTIITENGNMMGSQVETKLQEKYYFSNRFIRVITNGK